MIKAVDAARYLISLDEPLRYFPKDTLIQTHGCEIREGNARLNMILHLAQNIYISRHGEKLVDADFYAYETGCVIPEIQENYAALIGTRSLAAFSLPEDAKEYLRKVFAMLKDAPIEELILIDRDDPAWQEKHIQYYKADKKMDSLKFADAYKDMYEAANFYLARASGF